MRKNELILLEGKFGLLKHCLGERNFQAFEKTFFLQGHLKQLVFLQDFLSILALYPLRITKVSSLLLMCDYHIRFMRVEIAISLKNKLLLSCFFFHM